MNIEKAIAASLEPVVDTIIALERAIKDVQLIPGPQGELGQPGKDGENATLDDIVKELIATHADTLKGVPGVPGVPGKDADPALVAAQLHANTAFVASLKGQAGERGEQGNNGKDGASVAPELVALQLKQDSDFLAAIKGPQGNQGAPGYPGKDGEPGKDATPDDVAAFLKQDAYFMSVVKGATGEKGEQGNPGASGIDGKDGADADPQVVADLIKHDAAFTAQLTGMTGARGEDGIGIKKLAQTEDLLSLEVTLDNDQVVTFDLPVGKDGKDGKDGQSGAEGRNGLGIDAKQWIPGIYRAGAIVMHAIGRYAKAGCDTTAEPGSNADWQRLGTAGFRWTGLKSDAAVYEEGDLYIDKGTTFLWTGGKGHMFSQRGKDGKDGKDGRNGASPVGAVVSGKSICFAFDNGETVDVDVAPLIKSIVDAEIAERLTQPLLEAANDLDAASKGVPVNGMYRTKSTVKIRIA